MITEIFSNIFLTPGGLDNVFLGEDHRSKLLSSNHTSSFSPLMLTLEIGLEVDFVRWVHCKFPPFSSVCIL